MLYALEAAKHRLGAALPAGASRGKVGDVLADLAELQQSVFEDDGAPGRWEVVCAWAELLATLLRAPGLDRGTQALLLRGDETFHGLVPLLAVG